MKKPEDRFGLGNVSRRDFGLSIAGLGIAGALAKASPSLAQSPGEEKGPQKGSSGPECDLLIKGGTVIDPSQNLHAMLDVAVKGGKILEVSRDFPEDRAVNVLSAKDKIVTPGLVDLLAHLFEGVSVSAPYGGADFNCLAKGTTTAVDEGSAGYSMIAGFRKYIINTSSTRVYSLLNIGVTGTIVNDGSMANLGFVNTQLTAKAAIDNKPAVVGIFVRLGEGAAGSKEVEFEGLKRALEAAKIAGLPLVVHFFEQFTPMPAILKMLRKGDVLTHMCNRDRGILDANGKILPEVREARQRGVLFDSGHSAVHFNFETADKILQQDFLPDTISSCIVSRHAYKPNEGSPDLPTILSQFLLLGLSLDKVFELSTVRPAGVFDYGLELGTLRPGRVADIAIFEVGEGKFPFSDYLGQKRTGRQKLLPAAVIHSGRAQEVMDLHP